MVHDNRSEGNRVGNTYVYTYLSQYKNDGSISAAGFYRVDVHPDSAIRFGAISFNTWEEFEEYECDKGTPDLFIIREDTTGSNMFGLLT